MRVSVVATGIDVSDIAYEAPVPRRKMAEPLTPRTSEIAENVPEVAKVAASAPRRSRPEPAFEEDQPSLLSEFDDELFAARDEEPSVFDDTETAFESDELPVPVYQPEVRRAPAATAPAAKKPREGDLTGFVAPKPPAPGRPSPEALARLQVAVSKVPKPRDAAAPAARSNAQQEKAGRFGINSLINRMTGHAAEPAVREEPGRISPRAGLGESQTQDPDQERIDIPAFLRRQAN